MKISRARKHLQAFIRREDASMSILFAFFIVVLVGVAALSIDYSRMSNARAKMQETLDSAVLAAVKEQNRETAETTLATFINRFPEPAMMQDMAASIVEYGTTEITAQANATVKMMFAPIFGVATMPLTVSSSAARGSGYTELIFAIDMSSSTGMAATAQARADLERLSQPYTEQWGWYNNGKLPQGCAFACHGREGWEQDGKTMYQIAKENNIPLLEDELKFQFGGLVDMLLDPADENVAEGKRKITVYGFSKWGIPLITRSSSASAVKAAYDTFPENQRFETFFQFIFEDLDRALGASQGDGSQEHPTKMAILISDGIDSRDQFNSQNPIDTRYCDTLKSKGFKLAVVELRYPVLENNYLYRDTIGTGSGTPTVAERVSPAMEACASPGWYFQAADNSEIPVKFNELKQKVGTGTVRLTQ